MCIGGLRKGSGADGAEYVVVSYVVGGCKVIATEHGRHALSCMQKVWGA